MLPSMIFLLGMVGALAPELVRLYSIKSNPKEFRWSWFYLIVSMLFAGLGGLIALVLPATTYWGALYAGVSTPVLVNTILRKAGEGSDEEVKRARAMLPKRSHFGSFIGGL
jgi:hypothetical protein